jgi:hypothetical protein
MDNICFAYSPAGKGPLERHPLNVLSAGAAWPALLRSSCYLTLGAECLLMGVLTLICVRRGDFEVDLRRVIKR